MGGYNGGGTSSPVPNNDCSLGSGGATHIVRKFGLLRTLSKQDILAVAGAGGGSVCFANVGEYAKGGVAGGINLSGSNGIFGNSQHGTPGTGGTLNLGGTNFNAARSGGFRYGGSTPREYYQWYKPYVGGGAGVDLLM